MKIQDKIVEKAKYLANITSSSVPSKTAVYAATLDMADFVKDLLLKQAEDYFRENIYKVCNEEGAFRQRFVTNFIMELKKF